MRQLWFAPLALERSMPTAKDAVMAPVMLKPGDFFERYTIEALIGVGGMRCVYRARRRASARPAPPRRSTIQRGGDLDGGEIAGAPYIVMELVEGRTLRSLIAESPVPLAQRLVFQSSESTGGSIGKMIGLNG